MRDLSLWQISCDETGKARLHYREILINNSWLLSLERLAVILIGFSVNAAIALFQKNYKGHIKTGFSSSQSIK